MTSSHQESEREGPGRARRPESGSAVTFPDRCSPGRDCWEITAPLSSHCHDICHEWRGGEAGSYHRDAIITIVTSPSVSCPASLDCLWAWELSSPTISYSRWLVTSEMNTSFHFLGPFNWESGISIIYNLGVFVCHSQSWNLLKANLWYPILI